MTILDIKTRRHVVGTNRTLKAVSRGEASLVYLARDSSEYMTMKVKSACEERGVAIEYVATMKEIGESCAIGRNAVCAAELT
jgi:ribosomal protein L7Ae-like RNA K-turn-binding protein